MKSEGFKVKFMFSFLGLFVEAHSIFAANNDTMEGSLENLPFIISVPLKSGPVKY